MKQLALIAPEVFLAALALFVLVGDAFFPSKSKTWVTTGIVGLFLAGAAQVKCLVAACTPPTVVFGMISVDPMAAFFKIMIAISVILVLWLSYDYPEFEAEHMGTYVSLLLLSSVGMMFLVGSVDLLMAVISLELLSISSFILAGFILKRPSSTEGAIKFFLVGTLSAGILLFGASYYYGYFGTTRIEPLLRMAAAAQGADLALCVTMMFLIAGLGFKLAMVPFHMWAPDAYEGAPTPITAFMSVAPKAAAVGFLLRLLENHAGLGLTPVLAALAALTMTVGNLGALKQNNIKRMLAYSSVAQIGYILVAIVAGGSLGTQAAMVYMFIYLFMNMGVFAALLILSNQNRNEELPTFSGLSARSMGLALVIVVFALSLTGIPPMGGFIGKFAIFAAVIPHPELLWLGIVAVLNSVASLYYYFRIVHQMFFREPSGAGQITLSPALMSCLVLALGVTIVAGLLPNQLLGWVKTIIGS